MNWDLIALTEQLIGYNTISSRTNLPMIDFLESQLKTIGMEVWLDHATPAASPAPSAHAHDKNEPEQKANLFATLGPRDEPGLMLSGHTDVVPVEGQQWDTDPFQLVSKAGKHYGRGTADMKSFIAQCLLAAHAVRHKRLRVPLHLAFTYDEEVGCWGARHLVQTMQSDWHVRPRFSVIGEPSNFQVFRMHKGFHAVKVEVKGVEGHSSKPHKGANAIKTLAQVINKLSEIEKERQSCSSMETYFEAPYTTINAGLVTGGSAMNIIPNQATLQFEYRTMPGEDPMYVLHQVQGYVKEVLLPDFQKQHPQVDIRVNLLHQGPPMITEAGSEIETLVLALSGDNLSSAAPYYTEGAIFNEAGIPTVICGPGDIDQAHRPNEYVTDAQLQKGVPFLGKLIEQICC